MPSRLERWQASGDLHFVTFSCYHRQAYLAGGGDVFEEALERTSDCHGFAVLGYVVMPEHVHLLVSEPKEERLASGLQALKISVSKRSRERPFWQARYYDFNVCRDATRAQKLRYIHANPVRRGLVGRPEAWSWSSCLFYQTGVQRRVRISPFPSDLFAVG